MKNREKAKELLVHYIGLSVNLSDPSELESIVDLIVDAAVEEMKAAIQGQVPWNKSQAEPVEPKQSVQIGEVYKNAATGKKKVIRGPKGIAEVAEPGWQKVADEPHGDGDFSYMCGSDYCRCCQ